MITRERLLPYLKDRTVVYFRAKKGKFLLWAQSIFTKKEFGCKSMWTHVGLILGGYLYESTVRKNKGRMKKVLGIKFRKTTLIYGVIKTKVSERFSAEKIKKYNQFGFQLNFVQLDAKDWKAIKAAADKDVKGKRKYGGKEIPGTLIRLIRWRLTRNAKKKAALLQQENRWNTKAGYCVACVADWMEANIKKLDYVDVAHSISTVDEPWHDSGLACTNKIIR